MEKLFSSVNVLSVFLNSGKVFGKSIQVFYSFLLKKVVNERWVWKEVFWKLLLRALEVKFAVQKNFKRMIFDRGKISFLH